MALPFSEEIKEGCLSKLSSLSKDHCSTGSIVLHQIDLYTPDSSLVKLSFTLPDKTQPDTARGSRKEFSSMDLVLISTNDIAFPLRTANADTSLAYLLGLYTSSSKSEGSTLSVDRDQWELFKVQTGGKKRSVNGDKVIGSTVDLKYIIIDSLVSSWREFMALHQLYTLPRNMMASVLGLVPDTLELRISESICSDTYEMHSDAKVLCPTPPSSEPPGFSGSDVTEAKGDDVHGRAFNIHLIS
jgi:hypothetical protein